MHVHTSRHSGCAVMTPAQMAAAAISAGIDGVVITEHDYLWPADEAAELQAAFPQLEIFSGVEVSTAQGHFLVYGIGDGELFAPGMAVETLVERVRPAGGIVVMSHPGRYGDDVPEGVFTCPIDGLEVASGSILAYAVPVIDRIRRRLDVPGICGSDGHDTWEIGLYATDFSVPITDVHSLVEAVRSRRFEIYRNLPRIAELNTAVAEQVARTRDAIAAGLSADEVKRKFKISLSFQAGVRDDKDMRFV